MSNATRHATLSAVLAIAIVGAVVVTGQQPAQPGPFTNEQATAGRNAYRANCASCHRPDLAGRNEAQPLVGSSFFNKWRTQTPADLYNYIQSAMPPATPGAAGEQANLAIVAYILLANGASPGQ